MGGTRGGQRCPATRCSLCARAAVGPCARCRRSVCGDCCVLSDGGVSTFAICLVCNRGGADLRRSWLSLLVWLGGLVLVLAVILVLLLAV